MKQIKITSPEQFEKLLVKEFLPTLQAYMPNVRVGYNIKHPYICEISVQANPIQQHVLTVYKDSITGFAEYMNGVMGKYPARDIN